MEYGIALFPGTRPDVTAALTRFSADSKSKRVAKSLYLFVGATRPHTAVRVAGSGSIGVQATDARQRVLK